MYRDLHNNISVVRSISPITVGTTGTGRTGIVRDRAGYRGTEFILGYGAITATNATFTVVLKEGDVTGTMTSIADADLLGVEASATPGTGTRTSGTTMNVTKRVGYIGLKRYVSASIRSTVTAGTPIHADIILSMPLRMPVAT